MLDYCWFFSHQSRVKPAGINLKLPIFLPHSSHIDTMSLTAPSQQHGNEKMIPTSQPVTSHVPPMSKQQTVKGQSWPQIVTCSSHLLPTWWQRACLSGCSQLVPYWHWVVTVIKMWSKKLLVSQINDRSQLALGLILVGWVVLSEGSSLRSCPPEIEVQSRITFVRIDRKCHAPLGSYRKVQLAGFQNGLKAMLNVPCRC